MNQNNQQIMEIDFLKIVQVVLRRWWVVILSGLLVAAVFLGYTIGFIQPQYESSVLFYVNNSTVPFGTKIGISSVDINTAKTLVDTYCVILKTRLTLDDVSNELSKSGLTYSFGQLNGMINCGSEEGTEIFRVTVTCNHPSDACTIANTIAEVLPQKISSIVDGSSVRVVDYAVVSSGRISPNYGKNTMIGFAVGVVFAIAVLVVLYLLNDTITSEEWIITTFKDRIPLLASIPDANASSGSGYN